MAGEGRGRLAYCLFPGRSQRDVAGEKALREKEVEKLQKKLALVEGEVATAENDRRQFDGAVKQGREKESELRLVGSYS